jgi:hypothetical protein
MKTSGDGANTGWSEMLATDAQVHMARMTRDAAQSINTSSDTKIEFDNEDFDVGDIADPVTNDRFDIVRTGKYLISASWFCPGIDNADQVNIFIKLNGTTDFIRDTKGGHSPADQTLSASVVTIVELTAGDYLELYVRHTEGASQNTSTTLQFRPRMSVTELATSAGSGTLPAIAGSVTSTANVAAIGTTNLVGSATAGLYMVSGYMHTTTAGDGVCTSDVTIGWTYNSAAKTEEVVSNHDQEVDETYSQIPPTVVRVDGAANLTYAVSLDAGGDCTNATFDAYLIAERLQ